MENIQAKKGFDRLAPLYDSLLWLFFGKQLTIAQDYFIERIEDGSSVLILGGGTGKSLSGLIKGQSFSAITFLDISSGMITKAKEYLERNHPEQLGKITFLQGTYENLPASEKYHVIITPFVLDCLDDKVLGTTLTALYCKLEHEGQWLFTDFNVPSRSFFTRWLSKGVILSLYLFFNLFCNLRRHQLPDFSKHFSRLFVQPQDSNYFLKGLLVTQLYIKSAT